MFYPQNHPDNDDEVLNADMDSDMNDMTDSVVAQVNTRKQASQHQLRGEV
jgi:hypothetical protein